MAKPKKIKRDVWEWVRKANVGQVTHMGMSEWLWDVSVRLQYQERVGVSEPFPHEYKKYPYGLGFP